MSSFFRQAVLVLAVASIVGEAPSPAEAGKSKFNSVLSVGDAAPDWKGLPGVDGKQHGLADYKDSRVVVVVFTCNHCPISKVYADRLKSLARDYADRKVQVVAISVSRHPADGLPQMKAHAAMNKLPYPYLHDASQQTGRDYGATNTPHFFVLDGERRIAYMGAFDDHIEPSKVEKHYVVDAVDAVLNGRAPPVKESLQRGCPIEYD